MAVAVLQCIVHYHQRGAPNYHFTHRDVVDGMESAQIQEERTKILFNPDDISLEYFCIEYLLRRRLVFSIINISFLYILNFEKSTMMDMCYMTLIK